ncbi:hypothetical protein ACQ4M3_39470 [Leptolyngbya sp. AN03gr2]|uniref:hypothetical protein n=1 Tax=Leptolyngbya sp. AN10 TaxID=3423365 RepID=UPI003D31812F
MSKSKQKKHQRRVATEPVAAPVIPEAISESEIELRHHYQPERPPLPTKIL